VAEAKRLHPELRKVVGDLFEFANSGESLARSEADSLLAAMCHLPNVKPAHRVEGPQVAESTRRALARAVFQLDEVG
jgi:hypothetical protein